MNVIAEFVSPDGVIGGPRVQLPSTANTKQLAEIVNALLNNDPPVEYGFSINEEPLEESIEKYAKPEIVLTIVYYPLSVFKVRPLSRECGTLTGHTDSVLCVHFSAIGKLASGSGDRTVRIWDCDTVTPIHTLKGHTDWVGVVQWSPDGLLLASGAKDCLVKIWNGETGRLVRTLSGHKGLITALAWEPLACSTVRRLCSASRDSSLRVWDTSTGNVLFSLSGHSQAVQCVCWSGSGLIYSGSRDKLINVYDAKDGKLIRSLNGHAHWVNCLALSVGHSLRIGPYTPLADPPKNSNEAHEIARQNYAKALQSTKTSADDGERLVSASDDGTLYLWSPTKSSKPLCRMTGHQQQILFVSFSPDSRFIASCSYDKSIRIWDGRTGKFLRVLRGHVGAVYQLAWSPDSRMLVSASKDSTLKLWDPIKGTLTSDLPGHRDEVFVCDWAPDGVVVASGSYDRTLMLWRH